MGSSPLAWRRCILAPPRRSSAWAQQLACRSCFGSPLQESQLLLGCGYRGVCGCCPTHSQAIGCPGGEGRYLLWWMCPWGLLWLWGRILTGVPLKVGLWAGLWGCRAAELQRLVGKSELKEAPVMSLLPTGLRPDSDNTDHLSLCFFSTEHNTRSCSH